MTTPDRRALLERVGHAAEASEARALLLDPSTEIFADGASAVLRHATLHLLVSIGRPTRDLFAAALEGTAGHWFAIASEPHHREMPGWRWEPTLRFVLDAVDDSILTRHDPEVRPLEARELDRSSDGLAPEIQAALRTLITCGSPIAAWAEGRLAAIAYSVLETERHYHPSLLTFDAFRGRGMGRRAAMGLLAAQARSGRTPTAAPFESNRASVALCVEMGARLIGRQWMAVAAERS